MKSQNTKKFIYIFLLSVFGSSACFAQISTDAKSAETAAVEREKFDPAKNPNDDLQAAITKATKEKKRIILDVGGEWCGWCRKMDYYFLENKALAKLRGENFVWVKINMSEENENKEFLAKYPPIAGYPHLFVLETNGSLLHSQDTAQLEEPDLPIQSNPMEKDSLKKAQEKANARSYDIFKFAEFLKRWSSQ
ncbi:MAG: thioredoxin family protein [Pyrinomonadaceae bacterium]